MSMELGIAQLVLAFEERGKSETWLIVAAVSILLKETRVFAKFDQFLPVRSHFDTKRPVNFFHVATFPSPTFGPLFAFLCPLFFTKNNNLECRDVLKTVTVTSDQKRFGPYTAHN